MTEHVLKTPEPYFSLLASGVKTFDIRRNDRGFQTGDTVIIWEPDACGCKDPYCESRVAKVGEPLKFKILFIFSGDPSLRDLGGVLPGYVILALGKKA